MPRLSKQSPRLLRRLQIYLQSQRSSVLQTEMQAVKCLPGRIGFRMPDWGEAIANIHLVDIRNWPHSQFGQDMVCQWAKPAARLSISLKFCFSTLERIQGDVFQ